MLTCKRATELASQAMERELTLGEKIALRLHKLVCRPCDNFDRQVQFLHEMARTAGADDCEGKAESIRMSDVCKRRIKDAMEKTGTA